MNSEIFQKFTPNLKKALVEAEKVAGSKSSGVNTEHQLLALLGHKETLAYEILTSFDITTERIELIASLIGQKRKTGSGIISKDAKKCIQLAVSIASKYHHTTIGSEHLLLALVTGKTFNSYLVIERAGIDPKKIKKQIESIFKGISNSFKKSNSNLQFGVENMLGDENFDDNGNFNAQQGLPLFTQNPATTKKDSALDSFSTNLTKLAREGKLDPVIGRERETRRVIQTLSRRTKNNPIIIGEPGVGKTSIVEGLAQKVINGEIPNQLRNTEILSIDLGSILAGTMYRGQFESRIKKILAEIEKRGNIILFVDEIHMMVGAGSTEGSIDAANLLKPMLAKGQLRLIGSTTFDEFKKHIEKDQAFERRFQPIMIKEPTVSETKKILQGIKTRYEHFHNVLYTEDAIVAAAELSERYIHDRFLPDKAIDLIDEAGAVKNSENIKIDKTAVLKKQLAALLKRKESYILDEKYEEATLLREQEIKLTDEIRILAAQNSTRETATITGEDIANLVSEWTGVPVTAMSAIEKKKYLEIGNILKKSIIGQDQAIGELTKAIKRSRVGIGNPNRPIGSFIFLGPTGVGKTELAKVLSREIFGNEDALIKIDMSEFMERHNVSRLVGAPAGYIGYEEGGKLTEKIRKNPYSVILFDEIEKAHPEIFNILLQIMEDGTLTDAKGRLVDFKNTIIIMTSNLGTDILRRQASIGFNQANSSTAKYEKLKDSVLETVEKSFRPEFINRLDQIIVFYPLEEKTLQKIVDLQLEELKARLKQQGYLITIEKSVRNWIAQKSYKPEFGARPVRKFIQDNLEPVISDAILSEKYIKDQSIKLNLVEDKLVLE